MERDVNFCSKKVYLAMKNIGIYIDANMRIIKSIELGYIENATILKEFIRIYVSNQMNISIKSKLFKGNKACIGQYKESVKSNIKEAKRVYQIIKKYISNAAVKPEIYQKFNTTFFKTVLESIFTEIFKIKNRDSIFFKSLENLNSNYNSSIPNNYYDHCLDVIIQTSCEYIETVVSERLAKMATEILDITYENINTKYSKMIEVFSEFFNKRLGPIKFDFKIDNDFDIRASTLGGKSSKLPIVLTNNFIVENSTFKKLFSNSLKKEQPLANTEVSETGISELITTENFDLNTINDYLKKFKNDLKTEVLKKGYLSAFELISLPNTSNEKNIVDISAVSNKNNEKFDLNKIENQSQVDCNKTNSVSNNVTLEKKLMSKEETLLSMEKKVLKSNPTEDIIEDSQLYDQITDQPRIECFTDYNSTTSINLEYSNVNNINLTDKDELIQTIDEPEIRSKEIIKEEDTYEDMEEINSNQQNSECISKQNNIFKHSSNYFGGKDETSFKKDDATLFVGREDSTNMNRDKLLSENKDEHVPIDPIGEKIIYSNLEDNETTVYSEILPDAEALKED